MMCMDTPRSQRLVYLHNICRPHIHPVRGKLGPQEAVCKGTDWDSSGSHPSAPRSYHRDILHISTLSRRCALAVQLVSTTEHLVTLMLHSLCHVSPLDVSKQTWNRSASSRVFTSSVSYMQFKDRQMLGNPGQNAEDNLASNHNHDGIE